MSAKPTKNAARKAAPARNTRAPAAVTDKDIDTSDIPEVTDWSRAVRGKFYRPIKQQLTLRLDADVIAWFKDHARDGRGYQTSINRVLRDYVSGRARKRA